jgi:hypothetical protein
VSLPDEHIRNEIAKLLAEMLVKDFRADEQRQRAEANPDDRT